MDIRVIGLPGKDTISPEEVIVDHVYSLFNNS